MRTKQNLKICFTVFVAIIVALLLFWITSRDIQKEQNSDYTVKFYENETCIKEVTHHKNEYISQTELDEINKMVSNIDNNYYISWSFAKSYYEEVDFSELNNNATVYLFRFRNELKVSVIETGQFSYELSQDGPIKSGSSVKINVMPIQSERTYRPVVYANNRRLAANDAGEFVIDNITEDIEITVELKELISIAPKENQQFIYSGLDQNLEYLVKDSLGEIITIDNISVNYYYDNQNVTSMKDAGVYLVKFNYYGDEYYYEPIEYQVTMEKQVPSLEIANDTFYYNGSVQSLTVEDIITNSDGDIEFVNNNFKDIGVYDITVKLSESNNYISQTKTYTVQVRKGYPQILEYPKVSEAFYGDMLEEVELIGGQTDVPGKFFWLNPKEHLYDCSSKCSAYFIPNDKINYNNIFISLDITVISIQEMLERIKIDKEETMSYLENVDLASATALPIKASTYDANITWMSSNTIYQVDQDGKVNILNVIGSHKINLVGILTFKNVLEYVSIDFTVNIDPVLDKSNHTEQQTTNNQTQNINNEVRDIKVLIDYELISNQEVTLIEETNETTLAIDNKQPFINHSYNDLININEVIVWRIISDSDPGYYLKT